MKFKISVTGKVTDMSVFMDLRTDSFERVEQIRRYARKNKLQFKVEIIDET